MRKGRLVLIEGEIQTRSYETQDGQKRKAFEIVARNMQMLESKKAVTDYDSSQAPAKRPVPAPSPDVEELDIDEMGVDEFDVEDMPF